MIRKYHSSDNKSETDTLPKDNLMQSGGAATSVNEDATTSTGWPKSKSAISNGCSYENKNFWPRVGKPKMRLGGSK